MVSVITPAIVMIRLDTIVDKISINNHEIAVKLCRKYLDDFEAKTITVLTREDVIYFSDELFEIELLITLGVFNKAREQLQMLKKKVIKILVKYNMLRNRLMSNEASNDTIGSLAELPNDVLYEIVDKLQVEYVW
jgi:hypothetical protein